MRNEEADLTIPAPKVETGDDFTGTKLYWYDNLNDWKKEDKIRTCCWLMKMQHWKIEDIYHTGHKFYLLSLPILFGPVRCPTIIRFFVIGRKWYFYRIQRCSHRAICDAAADFRYTVHTILLWDRKSYVWTGFFDLKRDCNYTYWSKGRNKYKVAEFKSVFRWNKTKITRLPWLKTA